MGNTLSSFEYSLRISLADDLTVPENALIYFLQVSTISHQLIRSPNASGLDNQ